jgi:hypothetical protein
MLQRVLLFALCGALATASTMPTFHGFGLLRFPTNIRIMHQHVMILHGQVNIACNEAGSGNYFYLADYGTPRGVRSWPGNINQVEGTLYNFTISLDQWTPAVQLVLSQFNFNCTGYAPTVLWVGGTDEGALLKQLNAVSTVVYDELPSVNVTWASNPDIERPLVVSPQKWKFSAKTNSSVTIGMHVFDLVSKVSWGMFYFGANYSYAIRTDFQTITPPLANTTVMSKGVVTLAPGVYPLIGFQINDFADNAWSSWYYTADAVIQEINSRLPPSQHWHTVPEIVVE